MSSNQLIIHTDFPDLKLLSRGKVRDLYEVDGKLVIIATDRISAFDSVLPDGIPYKGMVLTALSEYWFNKTRDLVPNHMITTDIESYPESLKKHERVLEGRSMLVRKAERMPVEAVVRGYLSGSAWKEYKQDGSICGIKLPPGLKESSKLQEPIFTPSTKATSGHDMNISQNEVEKMIGKDVARLLKEKSLEVYLLARKIAEGKGIIISDTKMEFGFVDGKLTLIDELLTPDSSRFWDLEDYKPGRAQKSFDKQYVRDYLEKIGWDKEPPAPHLPPEVIRKTSEKYLEAYRRLTGSNLI